MPRRIAFSIIATIFIIMAGAGCEKESTQSDTTVLGLLKAEAYQERIEAVEAILYQSTPAGYGDLDRAGRALLDLHEEIHEREESPFIRSAANELLFLSARADVSDVGYSAPNLDAPRESWEQVRAELFGEAEWFRNTTAQVLSDQTPEAPKLDRKHKNQLRRTIDRLDALIADGHTECDLLGEPLYEPGMVGREGERQIASWSRFYRSWDERVTAAAQKLPPRPPLDGVVDFVQAYQQVELALGELRHVPMGVGAWSTPFEYQWSGRLNTASNHLDDARTSLATLP